MNKTGLRTALVHNHIIQINHAVVYGHAETGSWWLHAKVSNEVWPVDTVFEAVRDQAKITVGAPTV